MSDFFYRTEDLKPDEVLKYFVETTQDRRIIETIKGRNPTILVGSRGVGKSFLLRVVEQELSRDFDKERVFPVYLSFVKSSLLSSNDPDQFAHWMLAKICSSILRNLLKAGLVGGIPKSASALAGGTLDTTVQPTRVEQIATAFEESYKNPGKAVDSGFLPDVDDVKNALEDLARDLGISRFCLLIDEAAHIFVPSQQRQFFTLFRDLRAHFLTCNAAVYPGVTSYGETFQPSHDATLLKMERDISAEDYTEKMREIVAKQADSEVLKRIAQNRSNFAVLAYAATGNPRALIKTVAKAPRMNSTELNNVIRKYYRIDIWSEHSNLAEKYAGHRPIIDWGRLFIEAVVLPDIKQKNDAYLATEKTNTSAYFWIHRDAPESVHEALRVLAYTGVVEEQSSGIRATRSEIGTRYLVNLGCLFALEPTPASTAYDIVKQLSPKRMTEFGSNHIMFKEIAEAPSGEANNSAVFELSEQLAKPISVLDITEWQKAKLAGIGLKTVGEVFKATEEELKQAYYVGDIRARRMHNAAVAAVLEYLSG